MLRNFLDLKAEADALGLSYDLGNRAKAKGPLIKALGDYHLSQQPERNTWGMRFRRSFQSPQLALLIKHLKPHEILSVYESEDWVFDEKLNGVRDLLLNGPDGVEIFSRNLSTVDCLPISYTGQVELPDGVSSLPYFVLDNELISTDANISTIMNKSGVVTETILQAVSSLMAMNQEDSLAIQKEAGYPLKFVGFDLLHWKGEDLFKMQYKKRRQGVKHVVKLLTSLGAPVGISRAVTGSKKVPFLESLWEKGDEGIVAKRLDGLPNLKENRPRTGWIKIKRSTTGCLGDSIDGWISGFELGTPGKGFEKYVGALHISINLVDNKGDFIREHNIARVVNLTLEKRREITLYDASGTPYLDPDWIGKVVSVEGQAISARAFRVTHPRLLEFRDDKSAPECSMTESQLKSLVV